MVHKLGLVVLQWLRCTQRRTRVKGGVLFLNRAAVLFLGCPILPVGAENDPAGQRRARLSALSPWVPGVIQRAQPAALSLWVLGVIGGPV